MARPDGMKPARSVCTRSPEQRRRDDAIALATGVGVAVLLLAMAVFTTGCRSSASRPAVVATVDVADAPLTPEESQKNLASFDHVWTTIKDKHFDPKLNGADWPAAREEFRPKVEAATSMAEVRASMEAMIAKLNQTHFGIIPREAYTDDASSESTSVKSDRGKPGYLGLDLRAIGNKAIVTRVTPGSPADLAGVRTGWELVSVGGRQVRPVLARAVVRAEAEKRPAGTIQAMIAKTLASADIGQTRHLGFLDAADEATVVSVTGVEPPGAAVTFGRLPTQHLVLERKLLPGNVGYLRLSIWLDPARTMAFAQEAIAEYKDASGLVIDLRGNLGGLGGMAPGLSGFLVAERNKELGALVTRESRQKFIINPRSPRFDGPVAVLVDELSMSTSEIFAGGLQDIGRGKVIGVRTPGAALPSVIETLPNGDGFQWAFANYFSASGKVLEGEGVTPDVSVSLTRKALLEGRDDQVEAALTWLRSQAGVRAASGPARPEAVSRVSR